MIVRMPPYTPEEPYDDLVGRLQRWESSGATWRVLRRTGGRVTVAMYTCDGGEEMERTTSDDPAVLAFIGDRTSNERSRPTVVAVFGGNTVGPAVLETAAAVGGLIAARGAIVLTGGDGRGRGEVKEDALAGARTRGRWIGVVNSLGDVPTYDADERSFVLHPRIGHQRNFLGAAMCDAAVVLEGGDGTISELVSTLCLGKPVLLVGESWRTAWPAVWALFHGGDADRRALVEVTRRRLGSGRGPLAHAVQDVVTEERLAVTPACRHADLVDAVTTADDWLDSLVGVPSTGALPATDYLDSVRAAYDDWTTRPHG